jgi:hypothetical protein
MLLETNLDADLDSVRSEIRFIRELLSNFEGIELIAKEVHSRAVDYLQIDTDADALTSPLLVAETID